MINDYKKAMANLQLELEQYPMEISEGTKKLIADYHNQAIISRNKIVKDLLVQYQTDADHVLDLLEDEVNASIPKSQSPSIQANEERLALLKKALKYNNPYTDICDKLNLERTFFNIDDVANSDLTEVNGTLLYVINKFKQAKLNLTSDDFNYSPYTKQYMTAFFECLGNPDFNDIMARAFDNIYWTCPNLTTHLKLNVYVLWFKYDKELTIFCRNRNEEIFKLAQVNSSNYYDKYIECHKALEEALATDSYLNVTKFLNKELNINDYVISSPNHSKIFNRFLTGRKVEELSTEELEKYYQEIISLSNMIYELDNYRLFEFIIKDVIDRYNKRDQNKGVYNNKLKAIRKLEGSKDGYLKKYYALVAHHKDVNEQAIILNKVNGMIDELNKLYVELEDARFNDKIISGINQASTLYDALYSGNSLYGYLKKLISTHFTISDARAIDGYMQQLKTFLSDGDNVIIKSLSLFNEANITQMIENKCRLFNIRVDSPDLEDTEALKRDLNYIKTVYYIEKSPLKLADIKLICDVRDIKAKE